MSIAKVGKTFVVANTNDVKNVTASTVMKYAPNIIEAKINELNKAHENEVARKYNLCKRYTLDEYSREIENIRDQLKHIEIPEEKQRQWDEERERDKRKCEEDYENMIKGKMQGFSHLSAKKRDNIEFGLRLKYKPFDSTYPSQEECERLYIDSTRRELETVLMLLEQDEEKEKQFCRLLETRTHALESYRTSVEIVINNVKNTIIRCVKEMNRHTVSQYHFDLIEDAQHAFREVHPKKAENEVNKCIGTPEARKLTDTIEKVCEWIQNEYFKWCFFFARMTPDRLDEKEAYLCRKLKTSILELSMYVMELIDSIVSANSADMNTIDRAQIKNYVARMTEKTNVAIIKILPEKIMNYFTSHAPVEFRRIVSSLKKCYYDSSLGISEDFLNFDIDAPDYTESELREQFYKLYACEFEKAFNPKPEKSNPRVEEVEEINEVPSARRDAITNNDNETAAKGDSCAGKPADMTTQPVLRTFNTFADSITEKELISDELLKRYNEYFGTNSTLRAVIIIPEFKKRFETATRYVKRVKKTFYVKK